MIKREDHDKAKPCPFCGWLHIQGYWTSDNPGRVYIVTCAQCAAEVPGGDRGIALQNWNRREGGEISAFIAIIKEQADATRKFLKELDEQNEFYIGFLREKGNDRDSELGSS